MEIIKQIVFKFKKIDGNRPHSVHEFFHSCQESELLLRQLREFINDYQARINLSHKRKLLNYLDEGDKERFFQLKRIFIKSNKYAEVYRGDLTPSHKFVEFMKTLVGQYGLYFLYSQDKELLYLGKCIS